MGDAFLLFIFLILAFIFGNIIPQDSIFLGLFICIVLCAQLLKFLNKIWNVERDKNSDYPPKN